MQVPEPSPLILYRNHYQFAPGAVLCIAALEQALHSIYDLKL